MIQLKILKGPQKLGQEYDLKTGKSLLLGRGTHCDIQLLSFGVSKQHCKLTALPGGKLEVEDLGSSNGTFVNGVQIQKYALRPGDALGLSDFLFQIQWKPDLLPTAPASTAFAGITPLPSSQSSLGSSLKNDAIPIKLQNKKNNGLTSLFASWFDPIAEVFPIHKLIFLGFLIWTLVTVVLSVFPFSKEANLRIQENSVQTAKLYARQLARINQKAVIEQRISDIIPLLDEKPGQTKGILKSYILDAQRARIMSPTNEAGNSLPNAFAVKAVQQNQEWWTFDPVDNVAYVSAPILVGTEKGNVAAATALVIFDPSGDIFSFANILENALTSLIILLAFSLIAVFIYQRFVVAPVQQLALSLERAVAGNATFEKPKVAWDDLRDVGEKISNLIGRLPQNGVQSSEAPEDWNIRVAAEIGLAAAAFDPHLKIIEWSESMSQITGVRRDYAVGADIGVASRDMAFEGSVRELSERALINPWTPQNKSLEFQGHPHVMSMIYGSSNYLLLIRREETT